MRRTTRRRTRRRRRTTTRMTRRRLRLLLPHPKNVEAAKTRKYVIYFDVSTFQGFDISNYSHHLLLYFSEV
jgi:hypothetical protein